jgi:hypothetical protein
MEMSETKPKIFISYSYKDRELAEEIASAVKDVGANVWFDRDMKAGASWKDEIQKALEESRTFVIVLTPEALDSEWMNFEVGVALSRARLTGARVIPVLAKGIRPESLPLLLRDRVAVDANDLSGPEIHDLLRNLLARELQEKRAEQPSA